MKNNLAHCSSSTSRVRIDVFGIVQGVGFRPFVYSLARSLSLSGWVNNSGHGVTIEVEGTTKKVKEFLFKIKEEKPSESLIQRIRSVAVEPLGSRIFEVRESAASQKKISLISPDIATCQKCLNEMFDKTNRRYLYPFTTCSHCGPRYSIMESLPYDREHTSMKKFSMCPECYHEYQDPSDRRFHSQTNSCQRCGPHTELWDNKETLLCSSKKAISLAAESIGFGKIVAIKGLGGFHLVVDAKNEESISLLRRRKKREAKPFAVMFPSVEMIQQICFLSKRERFLLESRAAPIVLLKKKKNKSSFFANSLVFKNPFLGVMLPYTPLHHILMKDMRCPIVATSGNISNEPICIEEKEAFKKMDGVADVFLMHNRPIVRPVDDSLLRIIFNRPFMLRRARGYSPTGISLKEKMPTVLGLGGHLKNTISLSQGENVIISQHLGDLDTHENFIGWRKTKEDLKAFYEISSGIEACDMHPDYLSSKDAGTSSFSVVAIQHHHAHIVSCMGENNVQGEVLGLAWDGSGYGLDGSIWGGEFLAAGKIDFSRLGHFKPFSLPGGESAIKEPRRLAFAVLYQVFGKGLSDLDDLESMKAFSPKEKKLFAQMIKKKINSPLTSSVGRLFDAAASIIGIRQYSQFEGQAAMELEYSLQNKKTNQKYLFEIIESASVNQRRSFSTKDCFVVDWKNVFCSMILDVRAGISRGVIAGKFHNALADIAIKISKKIGIKNVVLSGGCFQNKYLTEKIIRQLRDEGFSPFWHHLVPSNDGGLSLGQAIIAGSRLKAQGVNTNSLGENHSY